jgi:predicted dehydrogenase
LKLGIVGSGGIVNTALDALSHIPTIELSAIIVREKSIDVGHELQHQYGIEKVLTNYDIALADDNIDTLYIGLPNNLHFDYCKRALLANKHVICEKPFTSNLDELKVLAALARDKQLFLFEAITLIHSPNLAAIQQHLTTIGEVKLVQCNYSQYSSRYPKYINGEVLPAFDPQFSGGALYDINVYNVHFVCHLFGKPSSLNYHANIGFNGIDTSGVLVLNYPTFTAICSGAKDSNSPSHATIQGTKGYTGIVGPTNEAKQVEYQRLNADPIIENRSQYANRMVDEFLQFETLQRDNNLSVCYNLLEHSLMVIDVLTQARAIAGIQFGNDAV